jgi:hypothetical protein
LFVCARNLFDGANGKTRRAISAVSLLVDQQNKSSGSYQQGKQNTGDKGIIVTAAAFMFALTVGILTAQSGNDGASNPTIRTLALQY